MRRPAAAAAPVVIKVGSSILTTEVGGLDDEGVHRVVVQVCAVIEAGHPAVLVSSGAVAAGLPALGLDGRPSDLPGLQAAAAVGQGRLMQRYADEFGDRDLVAGQVLLTRDVLANRAQYLHAREALTRMLGLGIVPIVNENDTVVVDELKFGDNDRLAAIVAHLVRAGMLVILTDTPGLYSGDPRFADDAELLSAVRNTDEILDSIQGRPGRFGSGGVATKVSAARMAAWSGIPTVVAGAETDGAAAAAVAGEDVGTWIEPHPSGLSAKKLWIAFGLPARGRLEVDAGAAAALTERGGSLLGVGVVSVDGEFGAGDAVEVFDGEGRLIAKGLTAAASADLGGAAPAPGNGSSTPVIHRDDLVVFV